MTAEHPKRAIPDTRPTPPLGRSQVLSGLKSPALRNVLLGGLRSPAYKGKTAKEIAAGVLEIDLTRQEPNV